MQITWNESHLSTDDTEQPMLQVNASMPMADLDSQIRLNDFSRIPRMDEVKTLLCY